MKAEVKFTVHPRSLPEALAGFQDILDTAPEKRRAILFLDRADTALKAAGVILRLRRNLDDASDSDSTVKLRGAVTQKVAPEILDLGARQLDVGADGEAAPAFELKTKVARLDTDQVLAGNQTAESIFTSDQNRLLTLLAPDFRWPSLSAWGPIGSRTWKFEPPGQDWLDSKVTIEHWVAAGQEILEFSGEVHADAAHAFLTRLLALMAEKSIVGFAQTKTTWALQTLKPVPLLRG